MHQAIKAEQLLIQSDIACAALPTPREIAVSCGQCLLVAAAQQTDMLQLLAANKVRWSKLFSRTAVSQQYLYEKLDEYGGSCGTTVNI